MAIPAFLTIQDLYDLVGARRVNAYFDDTFNGEVGDANENSAVQAILCTAEGIFASYAMRVYAGTLVDVTSPLRLLVENDALVRTMTAWIALQGAAERRTEFTDAQGNGPFKAQYDRAVAFFDRLSKGTARSAGEAQAGLGANTGGNFSPDEVRQTQSEFIFAPSRSSPFGRGGF